MPLSLAGHSLNDDILQVALCKKTTTTIQMPASVKVQHVQHDTDNNLHVLLPV